MNEIERAIEDFQRWAYMEGISDSTYETVIAALRAELSRQENAPLTCEGCRREDFQWVDECIGCVRQSHHEDRYEPKGE